MTPKDDDTRFGDEELVREGGVLVSRNGGHEVECNDDTCAEDDYVEDPVNDDGVPGTVDDVPYSYGVEVARAADETFESLDRSPAKSWDVGMTGPADDGDEKPLGEPEERELWRQQSALIEEAEAEEMHYAGLPESEIPEIVEASAEGAAEVLPDSPEGVSATGAATEE